ncbi:hypothetical protein [Paenibacillus sp. L3-i20]|uniref:hypothetical protein n=1 Tax=Paenibacillus sp. L3-i20 TaxID=2905833 RepID=UPI001EE06F75|nr:hypothetical protein [Paenibacillus sp. L3-i20]GKU76889.1 hypothetical protein L3i20_v212860 [Paenibacillus sp. L3-i20]
MHKDVIDSVYSFQLTDLLERVQRGEEVTANEVAETLVCGLQSTHNSFVDMAKTCREYTDIILRLQKEQSRERRIVQLFLSNHGLEYKFDNFEARILERIFHSK